MAFSIGQLSANVTADTGAFNASMNNVRRQGASVANNVQRNFRGIGQTMQNVGSTLTRSLTLPIAALGAASVKAFSTFDSEMTKSTAIMGNVSKEMRKQMEGAAMSVSEDLNIASSKAAESFFFLASAGLDAKQSVAALPQVAEFAKAGMFDMATATDLATDAQSALGLTVDDAAKNMKNMARVTDVLVKANTLANASVQQFSEALTNRAAAALRAANKEVEEGVAVLSAFADQGLKGQRAGEQLARIMRILSQEAAKNRELFQDLGIIDASGNLNNMADIIEVLTREMKGLSDAEKSAKLEQLGFTARVQSAIKPLLGAADAIREYEKGLKNAGGITEQVADKQMKSFSNQLGVTWQMVRNVGIEIGKRLAPALSDINTLIRSAVSTWRGFSDTTKDISLVISGLVAAIGPLSFAIGGLLKAVPLLTKGFSALNKTLLSNPYYAVGAAIAFVGSKAVIARSELNSLRDSIDNVLKSNTATLDEVNNKIAEIGELYSQAADNAADIPGKNAEDLIDPKLAGQLQKLVKLRDQLISKGIVNEEQTGQLAKTQQLLDFINTDLSEFHDITRNMNLVRPFVEAKKPMHEVIKAADMVKKGFQEFTADEIMNMEVPQPPLEKMFPPGSIGAIQERIAQLREKMKQTWKPEEVQGYRAQIEALRENIAELKGEGSNAFNALQQFGQLIGDAFTRAVVQGKKLGNILASVARQLASKAIMTGLKFLLPGGPAIGGAGFFSTLFGGSFHTGGIVSGGGEKMINAKGGEGVFTKGQMKAMGGLIRGGGNSMNERKMSRAFEMALGKHLQKLGPEEIYAMNRKGQFSF